MAALRAADDALNNHGRHRRSEPRALTRRTRFCARREGSKRWRCSAHWNGRAGRVRTRRAMEICAAGLDCTSRYGHQVYLPISVINHIKHSYWRKVRNRRTLPNPKFSVISVDSIAAAARIFRKNIVQKVQNDVAITVSTYDLFLPSCFENRAKTRNPLWIPWISELQFSQPRCLPIL
jgi:hypothetical protein